MGLTIQQYHDVKEIIEDLDSEIEDRPDNEGLIEIKENILKLLKNIDPKTESYIDSLYWNESLIHPPS